MARVAVVGGGPAGQSAALFTAKNGLDTVVFDADETALHHAHLFNYLGIESEDGSAFAEAGRAQVEDHGAEWVEAEVEAVEADGEGDGDGTGNGFVVRTADGEHAADYVVFATGQSRNLARELGCDLTDDGEIEVDREGRTSVDGAYAAGWATRKRRIQAVISAGDGAAAALAILAIEKDEAGFHDFDTPADAE